MELISQRSLQHGRFFRCVALAATLTVLFSRVIAASAPMSDVVYPASTPRMTGVRGEPPLSLGVKKLLFLRVRFPDDREDPVTLAEADETLAEVNEIYTRMSNGKFQLHWTITPVLPLDEAREVYGEPGGFDRFLNDARAAGGRAGFDYLDYDLDIVRHSGVPGFMGGNANLGVRGAQVQAPGAVLIVHELGHNLGLNHANAWVTGSLGVGGGSPPLPSNFPGQPEPRSIPVYADSFLGHESIIGPGYSAEYGDPFDIMGSGNVEFSAAYRQMLGWINEGQVAVAAPGLTTFRIQTSAGTLTNLPQALRVDATLNTPLSDREYWIQLPPCDTNLTISPGVLIRWAEPSAGHGGSQLLAPSASAPGANGGVMLAPGRTFSDGPSGVSISALSSTGEGPDTTAEVAIFIGVDRTNHVPSVAINAAAVALNIDEPLTLSATAEDPDGDPLLWHWDFADGLSETDTTAGKSAVNRVHSWRKAGDFVVTLEVSDRKGGLARANVLVRVGQPATFRISGRVLTPNGRPVVGVRVHNGISDAGNSESRNRYTFTDSQGAYTLTGLQQGSYAIGAYLFGYSMARHEPVRVSDQDLTGVDFQATEIPQVSVTAPQFISEDASLTNLFTLARTGPLDQPLTVQYRLGGTAMSSRDYVRPFISSVTFPADSNTAVVSLNILDDNDPESDETIRLDIGYPTQSQKVDANGNPYTVYFPGWDLQVVQGETNWVQTDPAYIPGTGAYATVTLRDNDLTVPSLPLITTNFRADGALEMAVRAPQDARVTLESSIDLTGWRPIQTNVVDQSGSAIFALPPASEKEFFRAKAENR